MSDYTTTSSTETATYSDTDEEMVPLLVILEDEYSICSFDTAMSESDILPELIDALDD